MKMKKAQNRWQSALQNNYGTPTLALSHGKGSYVWDMEGKKYLDMLGGIATTVVGQAHPKVVAAVSKQIAQLSHVSNFYIHEPGLSLAEKLISFTGEKSARVFFCNSGAEANEAALKLSRLTDRTRIISTRNAFHGRTIGALSLTGQSAKQRPFKPLLKDVVFAEYGDIASMKRLISRKVAMVILEPIQGESGVVVPPAGYLKAVRELCDKYGVLLCIDAVQTGMGRTGSWFGYEYSGITPDIITLAKGLGGGLPLGAMIAVTSKAPAFTAGEHGSTFGGNPVSCASGLAAIEVIEKGSLLKKVVERGEFIKREVAELDGVTLVRGEGLLLGIVLDEAIAASVVAAAKEEGLLLNAPDKNVIRIAPALTLTQAEAKVFIKKFSASLLRVKSEARA